MGLKKALASGTSSKRKKMTPSVHEVLDKAAYTWFVEMRAKNIPMSGNAVQQKALNYACLLGIDDFKASSGCLTRFRVHHNIVDKTLCSESASADTSKGGTPAESSMSQELQRVGAAASHMATRLTNPFDSDRAGHVTPVTPYTPAVAALPTPSQPGQSMEADGKYY
ncbi:hypothetical protein HPB50_011481 [Hyalomma asiaticum]|uniref:Uncharacterized protein n=1 Tax=Hyalomma asiaticum TaxID=266040 RepID=A0ACB7SPQ1_HYAAI|nr:hypothetical protein HPB50_011481 [Hyalomma asiaticum]